MDIHEDYASGVGRYMAKAFANRGHALFPEKISSGFRRATCAECERRCDGVPRASVRQPSLWTPGRRFVAVEFIPQVVTDRVRPLQSQRWLSPAIQREPCVNGDAPQRRELRDDLRGTHARPEQGDCYVGRHASQIDPLQRWVCSARSHRTWRLPGVDPWRPAGAAFFSSLISEVITTTWRAARTLLASGLPSLGGFLCEVIRRRNKPTPVEHLFGFCR